MLTALIITNIWTGAKNYSVEATIAVDIVAVCLGGMGKLADYCIIKCEKQALQDKKEMEEEQ